MTRNAALTVRLPGARIAPAKSTWTYGHTRLENSGMNGFSRCSIMAGRVRIITSLWRTGDDRTLPLLSHKWIKSRRGETVRTRVWLALRAWILVVDRVKTGRTVPLQVPVRPHFGIFWDFSDSFYAKFAESPFHALG